VPETVGSVRTSGAPVTTAVWADVAETLEPFEAVTTTLIVVPSSALTGM
jgi:hypothetical protein